MNKDDDLFQQDRKSPFENFASKTKVYVTRLFVMFLFMAWRAKQTSNFVL